MRRTDVECLDSLLDLAMSPSDGGQVEGRQNLSHRRGLLHQLLQRLDGDGRALCSERHGTKVRRVEAEVTNSRTDAPKVTAACWQTEPTKDIGQRSGLLHDRTERIGRVF